MKEGGFPVDDLSGKIRQFYEQDHIPYTKETKKSVIELDLKQGIYEIGAQDGAIHMLVDASSGGNIKPTVVFEKLCAFAGCDISASDIQVTRLETYTNLAKEGEPRQLVPLLLQN